MAAPSTRNIIPLLQFAAAAAPVETTVRVHLAGQTRTDMVRREPYYFLKKPAVVGAGAVPFVAEPISVTLAGRTRAEMPRHAPYYFLRPPAVLDSRPPANTQIYVTLVAIRPPPVRSRVRPPAVVSAFSAPAIRVDLARIRPPATKSVLRKPTVLQVFSGPAVHLTRIRPPTVRSRIRPPAIVLVPSVEQRLRTIDTPFVRIRPPKTRYFLRPPTVVRVPSVEQEQQTIKTSPARIRPPETKSVLRPPTVVIPADEPSLDQQTIRTWLTRIKPPQTRSILRKPATLEPFSFQLRNRTIRVDLARIRPPKIKSILWPPAVVGREIEDRIRTVLAPSARRRGKGVLRPPQALRVFSGARTYLTRIRPRRTIWKLRPPTKLAPVETKIRVALAPHARRPGRGQLRPPVALQVFESGQPSLTRIRPPAVHSRLRPPPVVAPAVLAQPITVWLVRIRPPAVRNILREPDLSRFVPPRGRVCGFDSTSTAVCFGEIVTQIECGFDSTPTRVTGSSSARSRISGQTGSRTRTVGTDQEAT